MNEKVYVDVNVLGDVVRNNYDITQFNTALYDYVYSCITLKEIHNAGDLAEQLIQVLELLNAVYISQPMNDKFQDSVTMDVNYSTTPSDEYSKYVTNNPNNLTHQNLDFHYILIAHLNGGNYSGDDVMSAFELASGNIPELRQQYEEAKIDLEKTLKLANQQPITQIIVREYLNTHKGQLGALYDNSNPIKDLWLLILPKLYEDTKNITPAEFFGWAFIDNATIYTKITSMHAALNKIGYAPDKKLNLINSIANSVCDAQHIMFAADCTVLLTNDKKLKIKAHAIYKYLGIPTEIQSTQ